MVTAEAGATMKPQITNQCRGNDMINLDRTTATRRARIDSLRKTALVAGV